MTHRWILTCLVAAALLVVTVVTGPSARAESGCHKGTDRTEIEPPQH